MWHSIKDLPPDQRLAIERLVGRRLQDDEGVNIEPSRLLKDAPTGEDRSRSYGQYTAQLDQLDQRSIDVADHELDAVIEEACERVRHPFKLTHGGG